MKKLIFSIVVLFTFSISGFAANTEETLVLKKTTELENINTLGFCGVKVVTSYVNEDGTILGTTEEFVWLGISSGTADCQKMIRAYAGSIGGTVH